MTRTLARRLLVVLAVLAGLLSPLAATPAHAFGDDYPYRTDTTNAADPWGFTKRQCVSFVAWELKQHGTTISNQTQKWGSALTWDEAARSLGKRVTTVPRIGAVAHWNAGESSRFYPAGGGTGTISAGRYGHVAYVTKIFGDGSVQVDQYNMGSTRAFSTMRLKAPRYLYVAR